MINYLEDLSSTVFTLGICNAVLILENILQNYEPKKRRIIQ